MRGGGVACLDDVAVAFVLGPVDADLLKVDLVEGPLLVGSRRRRVLERKRPEQHHEQQHAARPHVCTAAHSTVSSRGHSKRHAPRMSSRQGGMRIGGEGQASGGWLAAARAAACCCGGLLGTVVRVAAGKGRGTHMRVRTGKYCRPRPQPARTARAHTRRTMPRLRARHRSRCTGSEGATGR